MKIGMFTCGYQRYPLEYCFEDARRFGYDYIELWGGRPHAYAPDLKNGDIKTLRSLIDKYEMPVVGYTPEHNAYPYNFMIGSEAMWRSSVEYLTLCLEMTKEMGADFMLIGPAHAGYETPRSEIRERLRRTLAELVPTAEKLGCKIVLEALTTMESNSCTSADDLVDMMTYFDSESLVAMCDFVPPYVAHESILSYFKKLGDKMYHLHIVDSNGRSESHLIPGEGEMPMRELACELKEMHYERTATIELVTSYLNEPRLYARRAIDRFKSFLGT